MKKTMMLLGAALFGAVQAWGTMVECSTWADVKANLEAGNSVKLTQNVSVSGRGQAVYVNGGVVAEVTFDLNGHTVDAYNGTEQAGERDRLFVIHGNDVYELTIDDSVGGGGFVGHKKVYDHNGGFAYVGAYCRLVVNSGTITGFSTDCIGGAIAVSGENASLTMNGGTITNCTGGEGFYGDPIGAGAIFCADGQLKLRNGTISGCVSKTGGGAIGSIRASTVTIENMTLTNNESEETLYGGGAITVDGDKTTLTISGVTITDCKTYNGGGAICCRCNGSITGGTISGCSASHGAGAICCYGGEMTIENVTLTGNKVTVGETHVGGGALDFSAESTIGKYVLRNCTITGNATPSTGGALTIDSMSHVSIYDCTITGNTSGSGCGSIHINNVDESSAEIYGAVVSDNSPNDFSIVKANAFTVYGGVYGTNPADVSNLAIASGYTSTKVGSKWVVGKKITYDAYNHLTSGTYSFCPTNAAYVAAGWSAAPSAVVTGSGTDYTLMSTNVIDCNTWVQVRANLETGNDVRLIADVSQDGEASQTRLTTAGMSVSLDLNGHAVTCGTGSRLVDVYVQDGTGATFTLKDSSGGGVVRDGSWMNGGCVWIGSGNTLVMEGGKIYNCKGSVCGGAIFVNKGGAFTMNGGTIDSCANTSSDYGGGAIFVNEGGMLTMNGGTILNCSASELGGAIFYAGKATTLRNGTISGCSASYGGAVHVGSFANSVYLENMTFTGNRAVNGEGGAVNYHYSHEWCKIRNCTFTNNSASKSGGAFSADSSCSIFVYDCTITDNTSGSGCGAIHLKPKQYYGQNYMNIYGAVVAGNQPMDFHVECDDAAFIYGGVYGADPSATPSLSIVSDYAATLVGTKYVVGNGVMLDTKNRITGGTYTFCPTNAAYVASGVVVADGVDVTENAGTPPTWTLSLPIVYPDYLAKYSDVVKARFDAWATTFGSRDPDGVYTNAFLLNVATNNQTAAEEAFAIGSIVVTNGVVAFELPKPLVPATSFNGDLWLQCATNLPAADWKDVESGRFIDEKGAFLRCLIDLEHTLTPGTFPAEPTDTKTLKVLAY